MYIIELSDGNTVHRHVDHIKARDYSHDDVQSPGYVDANLDYVNANFSQSTEAPMTKLATNSSTTAESNLCRSTRVHRPPQRYDHSTFTCKPKREVHCMLGYSLYY